MPRARWWWGADPLEMLNEMRRAQEDLRQTTREFAGAGVYPAVNIYDDGESYMIRAEVPGIDKNKLEITTKGSEVTIRGERAFVPPDGAAFHRRERGMGVFHRVVSLPDDVEASKVAASYRNGVLEVMCPRAIASMPRKVTIS